MSTVTHKGQVEAICRRGGDRRGEVSYVTDHAPIAAPGKRQLPPRVLAVVVTAVFLLAAWLDRDNCVQANQAGFFLVVWHAIEAIGEVLGLVGEAVATTIEGAVSYLFSAVGWLAARVAGILASTGSMFAKVWEGLRLTYDDVLKPALLWLKGIIDDVTSWLKTFLKPVFDFLSDVRTAVMDIYKRFIAPILKILDITHAVLKTLADLHIAWAAALDKYVQQTQALITENFLRLLGWINEVRDVVNSVVTPDRLFQRLPFVSTLDRDAGYWIRMWWTKQIDPAVTAPTPSSGATSAPLDTPSAIGAELANAYVGQPNLLQAGIDAVAPIALDGFGFPNESIA